MIHLSIPKITSGIKIVHLANVCFRNLTDQKLTQSYVKITAMCIFKIKSRLLVVFLLIFLVMGWKAKTAQTQSTGDKPVEQEEEHSGPQRTA